MVASDPNGGGGGGGGQQLQVVQEQVRRAIIPQRNELVLVFQMLLDLPDKIASSTLLILPVVAVVVNRAPYRWWRRWWSRWWWKWRSKSKSAGRR